MNHPVFRGLISLLFFVMLLVSILPADARAVMESLPEEVPPVEPMPVSGPGLYFGRLHAHTTLSDGVLTPAEIFQQAAQHEGLDFFAVTDHSHSFDNHLFGQIHTDASAISQDWAAGKAAAAAASTDAFTALFGYELSWPATMQTGHISTFGTPGFQSWEQDGYNQFYGGLETCYQALSASPGAVSQFNHPGTQYGTFWDFEYSRKADDAISLLELGSGPDDLTYYIKALDKGWHVAPSSSQNSYTAIYAQTLTESGILDALRNRQAYATEDADLEILYSMDEHFMGARLEQRYLGQTADITVALFDPTDEAIGTVEVLTAGGRALARQSLDSNAGTLSFSLPNKPGYYFLRIIQADGDTAATAPIWIENTEDLGIAGFACKTDLPVQNEEVSFSLELYNRERQDFLVDSLELFANGQLAATHHPGPIEAQSSMTYPIRHAFDCMGKTQITVRINGTLEGCPRTYEASVELRFHQSSQITSILVDGSHGNAGLDQLTRLKALAKDQDIKLTVAQEEPSAQMLKNHRFVLICPPSEPFSPEFLNDLADYARYGGSLVICGQADAPGIRELNRLLDALDATMTIGGHLVLDPVNNDGNPHHLYLEILNRADPLCKGMSDNQVFRAVSSTTVDPGQGTWLVKGFDTTAVTGEKTKTKPVLMAREALSGGGSLLVCGSFFFADSNLAEPQNLWEEPYANLTITQTLLGLGGGSIPLSTIRQARNSTEHELLRIRGYVTAGTSNPYNRFPDTLYLQDKTGGIAVMPFSGEGIQQGTPVEITGYASIHNGNPILKLDSWKVLDGNLHQYKPAQGHWSALLNPGTLGNVLVQAEGKCSSIRYREDGTVSAFWLTDGEGNQAEIQIEPYIGNGSDGKNDLHKFIRKGRVIRAMGLLHTNEDGSTVIRVRNCEEVVYVPPRILPGVNPPTGDRSLPAAFLLLTGSLTGLLLLPRDKKRTSG